MSLDSTQRGFIGVYAEKVVTFNSHVDNDAITAAMDASGVSAINLHVKTLSNITATGLSFKVQYSPATDGDFWLDTTVTVTPNNTAGNVVSGTALTTLLAKRVRVIIDFTAFTAGSVQVVMLGQ